MSQQEEQYQASLARRHRAGFLFETLCLISTLFGILVLATLLGGVIWKAYGWFDLQFLRSYDSRFPEKAGILAGLWGSIWLIGLTALFSVPVGVGAALYLEEYAQQNFLTKLIQTNLANLAGVPSIVYGILGLTVFVRMFGLFPTESAKEIHIWLGIASLEIPVPFGRTVISGALTLSLLILPVVIVAAQEALRGVPPSIRHASYALGATKWMTIRHQVLPAAAPGILTGVILSVSRAVGETAPLVMIGALTYVAFTPGNVTTPAELISNPEGVMKAPFDTFTALPIQIFNWVSRNKAEYQNVAAAGILVLLIALLSMNSMAIFIRHRFQRHSRW